MIPDAPAPSPSTGAAPSSSTGAAGSPAAAGVPVPPAGDAAASRPASPRTADIWRRWRGVLGVLAAMILIATATVLLSQPRPGGYLDPEATTPGGAHALVQLLRDQGVDVRPARTAGEARAQAVPGSLLLVGRTEFLAEESLLREIASLPGDRLLVEPVTQALQELAPGVSAGALTDVKSRAPECRIPAAVKAGTAMIGGISYNPPQGWTGCYNGSLISGTADGRTVTVLGSGEFMTNRRLAGDGDAALAMNLAGSRPVVVWLVPSVPQIQGSGERASLQDLLPAGIGWAALHLLVAALLVALWRGRRLGPVVAERLPVVVRASETAEGRGRLYRSRKARDRAAAALRSAALERIVPRLGLAGEITPAGVVAAVATRTGQDAQQAGAVLYGAAPLDDAGLVALAGDLDILERQVRDS
ncbi:membrane protein [Planobispora rosea]|uniref:Membrane protein n=1 Tax=Planobispora rosea TaxID=35762 RepID=A0A8J3S460_PLARO|nr:DUF4350 domain-containing protein [Planobispora rosea]GGS99623.1 membrane protein [Planobispora rosea]GIH88076.1 membrane protein [Planobispora rosea]